MSGSFRAPGGITSGKAADLWSRGKRQRTAFPALGRSFSPHVTFMDLGPWLCGGLMDITSPFTHCTWLGRIEKVQAPLTTIRGGKLADEGSGRHAAPRPSASCRIYSARQLGPVCLGSQQE